MAFSWGGSQNCPPFWQNGPSPGAFYNFPGNQNNSSPFNNISSTQDFVKHSQTPITTGTSVIAVKFDGGIVMAADVLGSYGSLARFRDCPRLLRLNSNIIVGAGGDYADFQYLKDIMERKIIDEECMDDGMQLKPKALHCWLTRVLYNRRSKFDPLWNTYVVGGIQDGEPFLGAVDMLGTAYEDHCIATGLGAQIAKPLLREYTEHGKVLDEAKARELITKCLEVLFYRDARSYPKYQIAVITKDGAKVEGPLELTHKWELAHMIKGYN